MTNSADQDQLDSQKIYIVCIVGAYYGSAGPDFALDIVISRK